MRTRELVLTALTAVLFCGCPSRPGVKPVTADKVVAKSGRADYRTIQAALAAARDGDVILVRPGTYREEVKLPENRKGIELVGAGPDKTVIDAGGGYAAVRFNGDRHRVSGFTLRGGSSHGAYVPGGKHRIERCLITGNGDRGVYLSTMSGDGRAVIDHCTIVANRVSGIYDGNEGPGTRVTNSIIADNGRGIAIDGEPDKTIEVRYCCLKNTSTSNDEFAGEGNIRKDPQFVNPAKGDFRLGPSSPCRGAAADGSDMGCY
uniref:Right handed beta helix domain-containing protein n=1 Tax=candidate division WOR-3 bacterium TaxID=2052148 RepID=A0A7C4CBJ1_UNCW3